jgi:hypothetical protein
VVSPDSGNDADFGACVSPTSPVPGCQAQAGGVCDPVCQSGSCAWCGQKCSLDNTGVAICVARGSIDTGVKCTIFDEGTAQQHDECRAGTICLTPNVGDNMSYCFALCRSSEDCPGYVACATRPLGRGAVAMVCDPEYTTCNSAAAVGCCDPLVSAPAPNGCGNGRFCYLVTADPSGHSRTMCEYATGGKDRGEPCQTSRDCMEKLVCVPSGPAGSGTCRKVCNSSDLCGVGPCMPMGNEFGYCPG